MAEKKTTEMNLTELGNATAKMDEAALASAYQAEREAGPDKERAGAIKLYEKRAEELGITLTDAPTLVDGAVAAAVPGAQPAGPSASEEEREEHAKKIAALEARVAELEAGGDDGSIPAGKDFDGRTEVLKLHRQMEALAGHLNFRLPA